MHNRNLIIATLAMSISFGMTVKAEERVAVKTNLLYDALLNAKFRCRAESRAQVVYRSFR